MANKDTVIKLKAVPTEIFEGQKDTIRAKACYLAGWNDGAEAQAEISYKAGRDSFLDDVGNATIPLSEAHEKGRKVGVREGRKETWDTAITAAIQGAREEVVEWINENAPYYVCGECGFEQHLDDDWRAQKKIWGINSAD